MNAPALPDAHLLPRPSAATLAALREALSGMRLIDDPRLLDAASHDYAWYSPVLAERYAKERGDLVVRPTSMDELTRVAATCARLRVPVTLRGGGTGNYGQCTPLSGGLIIDMTGLNQVLGWTTEGLGLDARGQAQARVRCQAGMMINALEDATHARGWQLRMFPSTRDIATIGGFIAGGYGGAGTVLNGILKDAGNVTLIEVLTLEETPRLIELRGADIQKVHHAYGTNGIVVSLELALSPWVDWVHHIALFDGYDAALRFGCVATERVHPLPHATAKRLDAFLITAVDRRIAPFYADTFGALFPPERDAIFSMVRPEHLDDWRALMREMGGTETLAARFDELAPRGLIPTYECGWNHTTLMALRQDKSWSNLQTVFPWTPGQGIDVDLVMRQNQRWGDEVLRHHEFGYQFGECIAFELPLVAYLDRDRLYELMAEFEADGCMVFDNHVVTIEDGGMKTIDTAQIDFKRLADPHGLMNPGKTRGWQPEMAQP